MLVGLLECRTSTGRLDAIPTEMDGDVVRFEIRTFDLAVGDRRLDGDAFDDLALLVVKAAQKGPRSKQASKTAIGKR